MPALHLRPYRPEDLDPCADLFLRVFGEEPWNDRWPSVERARSYLADFVATPGFMGFVALESTQFVALCVGHRRRWWQGDEYYVDELCVAPERQGQGIGTRFLSYIEERLLEQGIRHVVLLTRTDVPAAAFYEKQGFRTSSGTIFMYRNLGPTDQGG